MRSLLDTHVLLWWLADDARLPKAHKKLLANVGASQPVIVAEISLWEVATLHNLGRIRLNRPLREWLEDAVAPPLV